MARKTKQNNITTPELLKQVNPENLQLLEDFLDYLKSTQRSDNTIASYRNDVEIFFVWNLLHNNNTFYCDLTKRNIMRYQNWLLTENGNSPARIRRLKASLSSMGNFIENILDSEFPDFRNIINKVESPLNQPVREKTILTAEQMDMLLSELMTSKRYDRACALALALYSGRRKSELLRFKVSDFNESRLVCGGALYKSSPIRTKGRGNGKMLECFTLASQFKPYFDAWMAERNRLGIDSVWLFPDRTNQAEHMNVATLNSWANCFTRILGVDFYWHAVRHRTVTSFKKVGIPDTVIQQYFGWSDISMVPIYSDLQADEQLGMYFTKDGIVAPQQRGFSDI